MSLLLVRLHKAVNTPGANLVEKKTGQLHRGSSTSRKGLFLVFAQYARGAFHERAVTT
jgi:hypothetical protein